VYLTDADVSIKDNVWILRVVTTENVDDLKMEDYKERNACVNALEPAVIACLKTTVSLPEPAVLCHVYACV